MKTTNCPFGPNGTVTVLDAGDYRMRAEDNAMMMAMYSRSIKGMQFHMDKVLENGSAKFMEKYYNIENHLSIGQNGNTNVAMEGVSMLAEFEVVGTNYFNGQASSTRYLDFSEIGVLLPDELEESHRPFIERLISFYEAVKEAKYDELKASLPQPEGVADRVWENTLKARSFDVARGWLPAGCRTLVGTYAGLEYWNKNSMRLMASPLKEIRGLGSRAHAALHASYPSSFNSEVDEAALEYETKCRAIKDEAVSEIPYIGETVIGTDMEMLGYLQGDMDDMPERPRKSRFPDHLAAYQLTIAGAMDFASIRDLQRHRGGVNLIGKLSTDHGMALWYLNQIPEALHGEAIEMQRLCITMYKSALDKTDVSEAQYVVPMGYRVSYMLTHGFPNFVYIAELRSALTVHPTARKVARDMGDWLEENFPDTTFYINREEDCLDPRRGSQTIAGIE